MIHKWLVEDKGYQGPSPGPEFMVEFYQQAVTEIGGEYLSDLFKPLEEPVVTITPPKPEKQQDDSAPKKPKMLQSSGIGMSSSPNLEAEVNPKAGFDFNDLEDMDDMLFEDLDSGSEPEEPKEEEDDVIALVQNFKSENPMGKTELEEVKLSRSGSDDFNRGGRITRSVTTFEKKKENNIVGNELEILREQLKLANTEIEKYQNFMLQIQKAVNWSN